MQKAGKICPLFYSHCKITLARRERAGERGQTTAINSSKGNIPQKIPLTPPKNSPHPPFGHPLPSERGKISLV